MASLRDLSVYLRRVNIELARNAEFADAVIGDLNSDLARLQSTGLLPSVVIFGPMILTRLYAVGATTESSQVIQAVLTLPGGIGAVYWDTETWFRLDYDSEREAKALRGAVPYEQCEPAIRGLIAPNAAGMIEELMTTSSL